MQRVVPPTLGELQAALKQIKENWSHVKRCELSDDGTRLVVDLSWTANKMGGYPDFYIPILPEAEDAREVVERIMELMKSRVQSVGEADARALFELIDRR